MDRVVALAGGKSKTEAIRAVIKSGLIDVLITDRFTAERLVKPVGIADFNNDGDLDIAFVDRPHLAKTLRVWSYRDGELQQIASRSGYSNHRIGEDFISGGIKTCNNKTMMITADVGWSRILATVLENDELITQDIGPFEGAASFEQAMRCS